MSEQTERFECFDDNYRFICEAGHTIEQSAAWLDVCPARSESARTGAVGPPCGAVIEARVIPYLGRTEEGR